jgi:hypothetical protein
MIAPRRQRCGYCHGTNWVPMLQGTRHGKPITVSVRCTHRRGSLGHDGRAAG